MKHSKLVKRAAAALLSVAMACNLGFTAFAQTVPAETDVTEAVEPAEVEAAETQAVEAEVEATAETAVEAMEAVEPGKELVPVETQGDSEVRVTFEVVGSDKLIGKNQTAEEFTYDLYTCNSGTDFEPKVYLSTAKNDANGSVVFPRKLEYSNADIGKTFYYVIVQKNEGKEHIHYDEIPTVLELSIVEINGKIYFGVGYAKAPATESSVWDQNFKFENYYEIPIEICAHKKVEGAEGVQPPELEDDKFVFNLTPMGVAPAPDSGNASATNKKDGSVTFDVITFTSKQVGSYTYQVTEEQKNEPGWKYDDHTATADVTVSYDEPTNTLSADVIYSGDNSFKNVYDISVKKQLEVAKTVVGANAPALQAGQFTFKMSPVGDAPVPKSENLTATNTADGAVLFDEITFTKEGTYQYAITENNVTAGNWTGDSKPITATVVVTMGAESKVLEADITYTDADGAAKDSFENIYFQPVKEQLVVGKTVTGEDAPEITELAGKFHFTLAPVGTAPMPADANATNTADGKVAFDEITFENAGTYKYTISETDINDPDWTTDSKPITATVVVTKNITEKKFDVAVSYTDAEGTTKNSFVNTFNPAKPTTANIVVSKSVTGEGVAALKDGQFSFTLTGKDGAPMPADVTATNTASGVVSFGSIDYNKAGVYTYEVKENNVSDPSWAKDGRTVTATVTVTKDSTNQLRAVVSYVGGAGTANNGFVNTYTKPEPATVQIEANKVLVGTTLSAKQFTFMLSALGDAPMPSGTTQKHLTAKNNTDGSVVYPVIDFTEDVPAEGKTYNYTIVEFAGTDASITYDERIVQVAVKVTKTAENKLQAVVSYSGGNGTAQNGFVNYYTKPAPATAQIQAGKVLEGAKLSSRQFTFMLSAENDAPMPGGTTQKHITATNNAEGVVLFPEIEYSDDVPAAGKYYTYTIVEFAGTNNSIIYDGRTVRVTVRVTKTAENKLQAEVMYTDGAGDAKNVFVNKYVQPDPVNVQVKATKQLNGTALTNGQFTFKLTAQNSAPMPVGAVNGTITATNNAAGEVLFPDIAFTEDVGTRGKTYLYTLEEVVGTNPSITYDAAKITVTVSVTKSAENKLQAVVSYAGGQGTDNNGFVNTYTKPAPGYYTPMVTKIVEGAKLQADEFIFTLSPISGTAGESRTVRNAANGAVDFGTLTLADGGEAYCDESGNRIYKYQITEYNEGRDGYLYDGSLYILTLTTGVNAQNTLVVTNVNVTRDGRQANAVVFENEFRGYPDPDPTPTPAPVPTPNPTPAPTPVPVIVPASVIPATGDAAGNMLAVYALLAMLSAAGFVTLTLKKKNHH